MAPSPGEQLNTPHSSASRFGGNVQCLGRSAREAAVSVAPPSKLLRINPPVTRCPTFGVPSTLVSGLTGNFGERDRDRTSSPGQVFGSSKPLMVAPQSKSVPAQKHGNPNLLESFAITNGIAYHKLSRTLPRRPGPLDPRAASDVKENRRHTIHNLETYRTGPSSNAKGSSVGKGSQAPPPSLMAGFKAQVKTVDPNGPAAASPANTIPPKLEHALLNSTQRLLETALYNFAMENMPSLLKELEWEIPEHGEFTAWARPIDTHARIVDDALSKIGSLLTAYQLRSAIKSASDIRHSAVHRLRVSIERLVILMRIAADVLDDGLRDVIHNNKLQTMLSALHARDWPRLELIINSPAKKLVPKHKLTGRDYRAHRRAELTRRRSASPIRSKVSTSRGERAAARDAVRNVGVSTIRRGPAEIIDLTADEKMPASTAHSSSRFIDLTVDDD